MDNYHYHFYEDTKAHELLKQLINKVNILNRNIMATQKDIKDEFENLKTAIAEERTQAREKLDELQASIDSLTASIAGGGTEAERDELLADIKAQVAEVKAIIPDPDAEPE